jgi:hypothetical protein
MLLVGPALFQRSHNILAIGVLIVIAIVCLKENRVKIKQQDQIWAGLARDIDVKQEKAEKGP